MDKKVLDHLHSDMLEIYKEVASICDRHNLKYFVVGGTLLGAVIHKGYIPWDDDFDIAMPRDDYDKFIDIYSKELSDRFYLHHTSTDSNYWIPFAKVRINNTIFLEEKRKNVDSHAGIYMDIFPFDYAGKCNTLSARLKWRIMTWMNNYIYTKVTGISKESKSGKILNCIFSLFTIKRLSLMRDNIMRSFDRGDRVFYVDLAGGRRLVNSYFRVDDILPIKEMIFGDISVKVPEDPNKYLLQLYTERYKIIPPKEQQITHEPVRIIFEDGMKYEKKISND